MKLNADVGEGAGHDEGLFRWIDLANVACGAHAGDVEEMKRTVDLAVTYGVAVGAHPGYPDRENFGRESMPMQPGELSCLVADQIGALNDVCRVLGTAVTYVKPHGALYHDVMQRADVLEEVLESVSLPVMIMAKPENEVQELLSKKYEVPLLFEAFADRAYTDDGDLLDRSLDDTVHDTPEKMITQVMQITQQGSVTTASGNKLPIRADTICVHGDNEASVTAAREIYQALRS